MSYKDLTDDGNRSNEKVLLKERQQKCVMSVFSITSGHVLLSIVVMRLYVTTSGLAAIFQPACHFRRPHAVLQADRQE
ncbi:hypothetical protein [Roseivivax halotolerans]|uniref:hypothetical protein n=1 Tax=Roseivivax halotolerans TaxID=93684 RepID=UPI001FE6A0A5|nr:hypothetical protein [Roseivivax halotolerans]